MFTYLCSEIGESRDIYRFDIEQDDLKEAVNLFNAFKGRKKYFANINLDKRYKLQTIDKFKPDVNWCVDNWWNEQEKIDLKIQVLEKVYAVKEFAELIKETSQELDNQANIMEQENIPLFQYKEFTLKDIFTIKQGNAIYTKKSRN